MRTYQRAPRGRANVNDPIQERKRARQLLECYLAGSNQAGAILTLKDIQKLWKAALATAAREAGKA